MLYRPTEREAMQRDQADVDVVDQAERDFRQSRGMPALFQRHIDDDEGATRTGFENDDAAVDMRRAAAVPRRVPKNILVQQQLDALNQQHRQGKKKNKKNKRARSDTAPREASQDDLRKSMQAMRRSNQ